MRRLDHSAIFLAIAGAYTPIMAVALDGWQKDCRAVCGVGRRHRRHDAGVVADREFHGGLSPRCT